MKPVVQEKDELENGNEQFYGISFKIEKNQLRIRLLILLCHKIVCRRPRRCPCLNRFHSGCKPDEKSDGPYHLTFPLQGSILRGSEIFGYDEKEYPERMLQRAAGWCKAVQGVRGKILSELSG